MKTCVFYIDNILNDKIIQNMLNMKIHNLHTWKYELDLFILMNDNKIIYENIYTYEINKSF